MAVFSKLRGGSKDKAPAKPAAAAVPFSERPIYVPRHAARDAMQCVPGLWAKDQNLYDKARQTRMENEIREREVDAIQAASPRVLNPKLSRHSSYMSLYGRDCSPLPSPGLNPFASGRSSFQSLSTLGYTEPVPAIPAQYVGPSAGPSSPAMSRASSYQARYQFPTSMSPSSHFQPFQPPYAGKGKGTASPLRSTSFAAVGTANTHSRAASSDIVPGLPALSPSGSFMHSSRSSTSSTSSGEAIELAPVPRIDSAMNTPELKNSQERFSPMLKHDYDRFYPNDPRTAGTMAKTPVVQVTEAAAPVSPVESPSLPPKKYFSHPKPDPATVAAKPAPVVVEAPKKKRFGLMRRSQAVAAC